MRGVLCAVVRRLRHSGATERKCSDEMQRRENGNTFTCCLRAMPACLLASSSHARARSNILLQLINLLTFVKQPNIDSKYQHATVSV